MQTPVPDGHLWYEQAGSGRPLVVLLHGGALDHRMWQPQLEHLRRRTLVVAPDARGHGLSSTPTTWFRQCDDVAALVRDLDAGPAVLVGISMGGGAAVDTALEHPDLVAGLVVGGAGTNEPTFEDPWVLGIQAEWARAIQAQDPQAWLAATLLFIAGPTRDLSDVDPEIVELCRQMASDTLARHVTPDAVPPTHVDGSWDRLGEVAVPVLGIAGDLDSPDHRRMVERLVAGVPDGEMATIEGTAHYPNLERPDRWNQLVDDFLDRRIRVRKAS